MQVRTTFLNKIMPVSITFIASIGYSMYAYHIITENYTGWITDLMMIWLGTPLLFLGGIIYATTLLPWIILIAKYGHSTHLKINPGKIFGWFILSAARYALGILTVFVGAICITFLGTIFNIPIHLIGMPVFLGIAGMVSAFCLWFAFFILESKTEIRTLHRLVFIGSMLAFTFGLFSFSMIPMLSVLGFAISDILPISSNVFFTSTIIPIIGLITWPTTITCVIMQQFNFSQPVTTSIPTNTKKHIYSS
jgi:hypothetical protein